MSRLFELKTRLNAAELDDLGDYLSDQLLTDDPDVILCDHTTRHTEDWLRQRGKDVAACVEWLQSLGGDCDCEVCLNVIYVGDVSPDD